MKKWLTFILFSFTSFLCYANPLPANEVFQVTPVKTDSKTFSISWEIKPGYFIYKDRIKIANSNNDLIQIDSISFPTNETKKDKQLNTYPIYRNQLSLPIKISNKHPGEGIIELHFQGCSDEGFCYPPEQRQIKLLINKNLELAKVEIIKAEDSPIIETDNSLPNKGQSNEIALDSKSELTDIVSSSSKTEEILASSHWVMAMIIFLGLGLLLSFTPCVLPMIPVLSSIIIGQGEKLSTRRAFLLSLSYVLSMSITYAVIGAVLASLGSNLQIAMQSTWAIAGFSVIFVLLALSLFGYYDLEIPSSWRTKLTAASPKGGRYLGAMVMGCLSTLILSPCVTAPLIGVLGYVARNGNILFGCMALFFLGLGMGIPLMLIGISAGKWLPKAGPWMDLVKSFFGMILLAVAIYLLSRILPFPLVAILWAALFIFAGVYWSPFKNLPRSFPTLIQHGVSLALVSLGLITLSNVFIPVPNSLKLVTSTSNSSSGANSSLPMQKVLTQEELHQAVKKAKGRPILIDFYADWCIACKAMEASTFKDPRVTQKLRDFVILKVDLTSNKESKVLLQQLNVIAPPTFLFLNKSGNELKNLRLVGEVGPEQFLAQLNQVAP